MTKFPKQLTKIQLMERANRKHRAMLAKGLPTPPGTKPRVYVPAGEPVFKPLPAPKISAGFLDHLIARFGGGRKHPEVPKDIKPKGDYKGS